MMNNHTIHLPASAGHIISTLNHAGFQAYAVGGCVRDSLLGREPGDWDITTDARPEEIKRLFEKTVDTGIRHGTVTVLVEGSPFEVTTFRKDGEYTDHRKPETVSFEASLEEDLSRRDFTVNAMAYHPETGVTDPFNGYLDLKDGVIRAVGDAVKRFDEDALRMLRAVRFSAQLGFEIDPVAEAAICQKSALIKEISWERIRVELTKVLTSPRPEKLKELKELRLMEHILPEFLPCFETPQNNPFHIYNVSEHILKVVAFIEDDTVLRWAALLHDIGKPATHTTDERGIDHFYGHNLQSVKIAEKLLERLRFDMKTIRKVAHLVYYHDMRIEPEEKKVRKALQRVGKEHFDALLKLMEADKRAQNPEKLYPRLDIIRQIREIYDRIDQEQQCVSLSGLRINGKDLIALGYREGQEIGSALNSLLELVIQNPQMNERKCLLTQACLWKEAGRKGENA